jgi:hypothetical protein
MSEPEKQLLIDELINISASAVTFVLTHIEGDCFYDKAYRDWSKQIPRAHRILSQLYYHDVIACYTIHGLNIRWQWTENFSKRAHKQLRERLKLQFERIPTPEPEPMARNKGADALWYALDEISISCKIDAEPDTIRVDAWTTQHYNKLLESGSVGERGHFMSMKLAGARFQMELVPPPKPERTQRVGKRKRMSETRTAQTARSWLKLSSQ